MVQGCLQLVMAKLTTDQTPAAFVKSLSIGTAADLSHDELGWWRESYERSSQSCRVLTRDADVTASTVELCLQGREALPVLEAIDSGAEVRTFLTKSN